MSADEIFFDTNILVYLISGEARKARVSNELIVEGGVISVQVLNEFVSVARRKYRLTWRDIGVVLATAKASCRIVPLSLEIHELGLKLAERHQFSPYDSMIVAAAELAGCAVLYTEDMHDGLVIGGLTLRNPYR